MENKIIKFTEEEKQLFFEWLFNECNTPSEEIFFLLDNLKEETKNEIINNVLKYL